MMEISTGDIIALCALCLSIYATWRTQKYKRKEEKFLNLQQQINSLQLKKESREAEEIKRADIGANFYKLSPSSRRLRVFNKGRSPAINVMLEFPDGDSIVPASDIKSKFPMETMEPGQSVDLFAAATMKTKSKHTVKVSWQDSNGEDRTKTIYATI